MWRCPRCNEVVDDQFDMCWNCGTNQDGTASAGFDPERDDPSVPDPGPGPLDTEGRETASDNPQQRLTEQEWAERVCKWLGRGLGIPTLVLGCLVVNIVGMEGLWTDLPLTPSEVRQRAREDWRNYCERYDEYVNLAKGRYTDFKDTTPIRQARVHGWPLPYLYYGCLSAGKTGIRPRSWPCDGTLLYEFRSSALVVDLSVASVLIAVGTTVLWRIRGPAKLRLSFGLGTMLTLTAAIAAWLGLWVDNEVFLSGLLSQLDEWPALMAIWIGRLATFIGIYCCWVFLFRSIGRVSRGLLRRPPCTT
jgi:hypothetical protein